jgi:excisionase family DNA binding protein
MPPPDLLSTTRAAVLLDCSLKTVHRLVADGKLTPYMLAPGGPHGAFMFKRSDVERLAKKRGTVTDTAVAS